MYFNILTWMDNSHLYRLNVPKLYLNKLQMMLSFWKYCNEIRFAKCLYKTQIRRWLMKIYHHSRRKITLFHGFISLIYLGLLILYSRTEKGHCFLISKYLATFNIIAWSSLLHSEKEKKSVISIKSL